MTPTQRSLAWLRKRGWTVGITERWNPYVGVRQDLFGFVDLIACHPHAGILAVQTTSGSNVAARVQKIRGIPAALAWVKAGGKISVHGWRKVGKAGKRKTWQLRTVEVDTILLQGDEQ